MFRLDLGKFNKNGGFLVSVIGSQVLAAILYQTSLGDFVYTTDGSGNVVLDNQGSLGSTNDGQIYSGRGLELLATNNLTVGDAAKWTTWFDFADASFHKVFGAKTFNTITVNNILISENEVSDADILKLNANPNLMGKLALETLGATKTIPELDMVMDAGASADKWYPCMESSLSTVYNARSTDSVTITNYAETIRTNADFSRKGLQTTAFVQDGAGVPTSYSSNLFQFNQYSYIDTKWIASHIAPFTIDIVFESDDTYANVNASVIFGEYSGSASATNIVCVFKQNLTGNNRYAIALFGKSYTTTGLTNGLHTLQIEFNGSNTAYIYLDGAIIPTATLSAMTPTAPTLSSYIGAGNTLNRDEYANAVGSVIINNKSRTESERIAVYAQLKAIYQSLP